MTFEKFDEKYNPIVRDNDTIQWETYGNDLLVVQLYPNNKIWTCVETEGKLYLIPGYHFVDRLFYVICNNDWTDENEEVEY
jgi:hypothetical protein